MPNFWHKPAYLRKNPSQFRNKSKEAVVRPSDDDEIDPSDNCCLPPLMEDVIRTSLGYLIGAALTPSCTDIIKVCYRPEGFKNSNYISSSSKYTFGRLRPHFLDVCQPNWNEIDCSPEENGGGLFSRYIEADEYRCEM